MSKITVPNRKDLDDAVENAAKLVAQAYAELKQAGANDAIDLLADVCTKAVQGEGACLIPVTVGSFKSFHAQLSAVGAMPNRRIQAEFIESIYMQKQQAVVTMFNGIGIWDETSSKAIVQFPS